MSEDSRRLEWERGAWNQRETLLKKELQEKRDEIARLKAQNEQYANAIDNYRDDLKTIIDKIAHGEWTPDRVRRFAIEVMTHTKSAESEADS